MLTALIISLILFMVVMPIAIAVVCVLLIPDEIVEKYNV